MWPVKRRQLVAEYRETVTRDGLVAEFIEQRQFLEVFHGCYAVVKLIE